MALPPFPNQQFTDGPQSTTLHPTWKKYWESVRAHINKQDRTVAADAGDNSITTTNTNYTYVFDTPLTASRTVTFPTTAEIGTRIRVTRTANATGAYNLTVNGKAMTTAGTWIEWEMSTTGWIQTAYGSLL